MGVLAQRLAKSYHTQSVLRYQPRLSILALAQQARRLHVSAFKMSPTKRKQEKDTSLPKGKKPKFEIPAYHLTPSRRDDSGEIMWPARREQIERAREIIKEWYAATYQS